LSPFDPLLRDRARTERLFGFRYRIEVFVPAARREYGYYVFPMLEGKQLIGRIDMKHRRNEGVLAVKGLWFEPGVRHGVGRRRRLEAELERIRRFTGAERVVFADGAAKTGA
ncbi:MAG: crosslink repair DNA glycosylase YcaQ family protein, partial [Alphaproteobacteria bacterium]